MLRLLLFLAIPLNLTAAPLKIVTIGDSLTDGYGEVADLADIPLLGSLVGDKVYPEPDQPSSNNRAFNWPELLMLFRPEEATFGPEGTWGNIEEIFGVPFPTGDLRFKGFQKNFALVGSTTTNWEALLDSTLFGLPEDDFPLNFLYYDTKVSLFEQLATADAVVIMLGGNDLKNDYNDIFNTATPSVYLNPLRARLEIIHAAVRTENSTVPIIVATVPDVGATPNIYQIYNDPTLQATTRANIAAMNQAIISTFEAKPNTAVARVDRLTDLAFDLSPFHLNGTEFTIEGDPYNPPDHLFCKDNFHPATAAQALIANEIMIAINSKLPNSMTLFSNREILESTLLLDPDQPFIDWASDFSLGADSFDLDSDGDGTPNGLEMLFGTSPVLPDSGLSGKWSPSNSLTWSIDEEASRYVDWVAEESTDLDDWTEVPPGRLNVSSGTGTASPASNDRGFFRIRATPSP